MRRTKWDYYVGLDVSLGTVAVCVINADGKLNFERSVACEIEDIVDCLRDVPTAALHIGFEAGPMCQYLFRGLRTAGFDVVCMEARQVNAALSAMRNKTDMTDARGIAQVLRSGCLIQFTSKAVKPTCSCLCVMHGPYFTQLTASLTDA